VRENRVLSGALAAITAAVVGVILNLAIWFALHVLFAQVDVIVSGPVQLHIPDPTTLNAGALLLTVLSALALLGFKVPVPVLLILSAAAGLVLRGSGF
jgi:chromate transporter